MKNKKLMSIVMSASLVISGIGLAPCKAMAETKNEVKVEAKQTQDNDVEKSAKELVKEARKNLNEENIKKARIAISKMPKSNVKKLYSEVLNFNIYNHLGDNISPVDELMKAFKKSQEIKSCVSQSQFTMNIKGENLSEEEKMKLAQIEQVINKLKINGKSQIKSEKQGEKVYFKSNVNIDVMGNPINFDLWEDVDVTQDTPKINMIISIPEMIKAFAPELGEKKYLVYDFDNISKLLGENGTGTQNVDFDGIMKAATKFSKNFENIFVDFLTVEDAKYNIVSRKDKKQVTIGNGVQNVQIYEIKINNDNLAEILKDAMKNEEIRTAFVEYVNDIMKLIPEQDKKELKGVDLQKQMNESMDEMIEEAIKGLDSIKDLVEYELVFDFGVNNDGYIVYQTGNMKFTADVAKLQAKIKEIKNTQLEVKEENKVQKSNSKYTFTIKYTSDLDKVNETIEFDPIPEITEKNSIKYTDLLMQAMNGGGKTEPNSQAE
ncbi:hypothetical protein OW763_02580 [Clostridium aestuarii]|uniref:Lipoprotein n=1 Tax=Clostridium aestuarii TaxID=338193 RepID=A0ABT4CWA4_9CLOT|nr:hypothetical protein [Clostridium aestuarii]MCY6483241.1 hypothetical protein [Clostridium aestuarii]